MGPHQPTLPNLPVLRRQKGITLESISAATCIGQRYLEAIERGEFTVLPGGIYDVSYIRQYAHAVDLPEHMVLDCYYAAKDSAAARVPSAGLGGPEAIAHAQAYLPAIPKSLFTVSIRKLRKT